MRGNLVFTLCLPIPLLFLASQPVLTPGKAPLHDGEGAGVRAEGCSRGRAGAGLDRVLGVCWSCGALGCARPRGFFSVLGHAGLSTNHALGCTGIDVCYRALIEAGITGDHTLSTAGLLRAGLEHLEGAGLHS